MPLDYQNRNLALAAHAFGWCCHWKWNIGFDSIQLHNQTHETRIIGNKIRTIIWYYFISNRLFLWLMFMCNHALHCFLFYFLGSNFQRVCILLVFLFSVIWHSKLRLRTAIVSFLDISICRVTGQTDGRLIFLCHYCNLSSLFLILRLPVVSLSWNYSITMHNSVLVDRHACAECLSKAGKMLTRLYWCVLPHMPVFVYACLRICRVCRRHIFKSTQRKYTIIFQVELHVFSISWEIGTICCVDGRTKICCRREEGSETRNWHSNISGWIHFSHNLKALVFLLHWQLQCGYCCCRSQWLLVYCNSPIHLIAYSTSYSGNNNRMDG